MSAKKGRKQASFASLFQDFLLVFSVIALIVAAILVYPHVMSNTVTTSSQASETN